MSSGTPGKRIQRGRLKDVLFGIFIYGGFSFLSLFIVYPFYYLVINSLNGSLDHGTAFFWPAKWTIVAYRIVFTDEALLRSLLVSALRVVSGSIMSVALCSTAAFALRKRTLKLRWFYLIMFTIPMFFGGGLIPGFLILKALGLIDTFLVYILPRAWNFFFIIIFMSCFNDISDSMEESALMDGANHFTIFYRIYLPMSVPVLATIFLFTGVDHWGSWFDSIYFVKKTSLQTIAAFLVRILQREGTEAINRDWSKIQDVENQVSSSAGIRFAVVVIGIIPVLMVYPFIQKYFVKGIRLGSI